MEIDGILPILRPGVMALVSIVMPISGKQPKNQQGDRVLYIKTKSLCFIQVCKLGLSVCPAY